VEAGDRERQHYFCRNCGTAVRPEDTFCPYCGQTLKADAGASHVRQRTPATSPSHLSGAISRLWPADPRREIVAGVLVAAAVVGLLLGLVYLLLALRGAFADPSVPWTLGLVVFSLIHGGASWASVSGTSLLGIGGSLELGLPVTAFALLPFFSLLVLSRVVARRTETTVLFACITALAYALVVGLLAIVGTASVEQAGEGGTVQFAANPFSTSWRAFLLAIVAGLLGAAVPRGPLLPTRSRQVIRGAFAAIGISLAITLLLAVILWLVQGSDVPAQQVPNGLPKQLAQEGLPAGDLLATVGMLFTLLPALLGVLWLFAHGLPLGLQGARDLADVPLIGPALADVPLQVSLLGNWPGGTSWRLLLLGPVVGLVVGGMLAARGAPRNERWWQGALIVVPYTAFAALVAVLCRITAELSIAALTLSLAFGSSLPWLLALLPVTGMLGALGGLLARGGTVWAPNPQRTFLAAAIASAVVLLVSLAGVLALPSQSTSQLAASDLPDSKSSSKTPALTPKVDTKTPSSDLAGASPDPALAPLLPALQQRTTAPIILPAELPDQLKNVAIGVGVGRSPYGTSGNRYTILFLTQPPREIVQPYVHATTAGTFVASPQPRSIPPGVTTTSRGTVTLLDGVAATLQIEEGPQGSNRGTRSVGTFENDGWTYTLDLPAGGNYPPELVEEVLSTMVMVPQTEELNSENSIGSEASLRQAMEDYYRAVDRRDWPYTYENLDSQTKQRFTSSEWIQKNQYLSDLDPLVRSTPEIASEVSTFSPVEVTLTQTFSSGATGSRTTYFVWEGGSWKHRFSQEEYDLFLAGTSYEEFVEAKQAGL
jgi:hypothetical protein